MCETVSIVLPLPKRVLSPNHPIASMRGRMAKAAAVKKYRDQAKTAALASGVETGPWELASVSATFYFSTKRRRDQDNHMAMLKPAYDGLVDAGLLVDDDHEHLKREPPTFEIDRDFPRVEMVLTRKG
ncbi:MAG: hypothetical protein LUE17_12125 [Planctomycetaceae bacterium]|nr:hypothetical protein [Planctomycetaceae bacterium]